MRSCTIEELEKILSLPDGCCLVDVREEAEFQSEHIHRFACLPLSRMPESLRTLPTDRPIVVVCRSGARARHAAELIERTGREDIRVLEGGIRSWISAGRDVVKGPRRTWSLDRQVRFAAGMMVLAGVALAHWAHPGWAALSAFVAAGLVFSAVTDRCGMTKLLAKLPWNHA